MNSQRCFCNWGGRFYRSHRPRRGLTICGDSMKFYPFSQIRLLLPLGFLVLGCGGGSKTTASPDAQSDSLAETDAQSEAATDGAADAGDTTTDTQLVTSSDALTDSAETDV